MAETLEFAPQFEVVIDFAVEDDGRIAVVGANGLVAGLQVKDLQAGCAERTRSGFVDALLVRTAMDKGRRGRCYPLRTRQSIFMCETNYPAHDVLANTSGCLFN